MAKSRIEQIEEIVCARIRTVSADPLEEGDDPLIYKEVLDVDVPPSVFPASTMLFTYPSQEWGALGMAITDNSWRWIQRSVWDASDEAIAQREMKRMLPALLRTIALIDPQTELILDDGTVFELDIEDAGDPNTRNTVAGMVLVKNLFLTATTEEFAGA